MDLIESRPNETVNYYYLGITADNTSQRIPGILITFIREKAAYQPQCKKLRSLTSRINSKKYGQFLLTEANNCCAFSGCDRPLILTRGGLASDSYI